MHVNPGGILEECWGIAQEKEGPTCRAKTRVRVPLKQIEYGVYGDLTIIHSSKNILYLLKGDCVWRNAYVMEVPEDTGEPSIFSWTDGGLSKHYADSSFT